MAAIDWDFVIAWLLGPSFGLLTILYLQRRGWHRLSQIDLPHLIYLIFGLLWGLGTLFAHPRIRDLALFMPFMRLAPYLLAASSSLLLLTTINLVRQRRLHWRWSLVLPALLILFALFHDGALRTDLGPTLLLGVRRFDRDGLWRSSLLVANLTTYVAALRLSLELYRAGWGLVYRNRLRYWSLTLLLTALGDALAILLSHPSLLLYLGGLLKIGGATMATAILLIPYWPRTSHLAQRILTILAMGLMTFGLLLTGILLSLAIMPNNEQGATLVGAAFVSAIIALVFAPLQHGVQSIIDRLILGQRADWRNVLAEYNRQISRQLELEELAETVMALLSDALHLETENGVGALIIAKVTEKKAVGLIPVTRSGHHYMRDLLCSADSPLAAYLRESASPLAQFDVEELPDFADLPDDEKRRLEQWDATLYVPLRSLGNPVGVLALGSKRSDMPYDAAEIRFLEALADPTATALEQAQYLSDLKRTNVQLTRLSDQLSQVNRRLYEADQLKSGFISVITHELRRPFVPLSHALQLLTQQSLEHLTEEQEEQLQTLEKGITELKQLVDHIIAFASLLGQRGELKMEPLDLSQAIAETVKAVRPMSQRQQVTVDARVWPGLPPVLGDRERLVEAIYHLAHNAIKFNKAGGWVRIRCQPDNGNVEIKVQDSGVGIPPDRMGDLWNAFPDTDEASRRDVEGLGLGLALVRYVVVAHGGEVWAESTPGQGSTFCLKLPALKAGEMYRPRVTK